MANIAQALGGSPQGVPQPDAVPQRRDMSLDQILEMLDFGFRRAHDQEALIRDRSLRSGFTIDPRKPRPPEEQLRQIIASNMQRQGRPVRIKQAEDYAALISPRSQLVDINRATGPAQGAQILSALPQAIQRLFGLED